jgi:osmotically-inducible protein OsmY
MRSDSDIKRNVEDKLRSAPDLDETDIAVTVRDGVVTLTGFLRSDEEKWEAEDATKSVDGVLGVVNDIDVRLPGIDQGADPDLARDAVAVISAKLPVAAKRIRVIVMDGVVTLEGEVEWSYQRDDAESAVRTARGIKGIVNLIQVKPRAASTEP